MRISDWSSDVCSSDLRIVWAFDARMAEIIRSTREPMIGQMRLTWWREALTKDPKVEGSGEPLMDALRSEEHTSELQSLMRISYAVFCLKKKNKRDQQQWKNCAY